MVTTATIHKHICLRNQQDLPAVYLMLHAYSSHNIRHALHVGSCCVPKPCRAVASQQSCSNHVWIDAGHLEVCFKLFHLQQASTRVGCNSSQDVLQLEICFGATRSGAGPHSSTHDKVTAVSLSTSIFKLTALSLCSAFPSPHPLKAVLAPSRSESCRLPAV